MTEKRIFRSTGARAGVGLGDEKSGGVNAGATTEGAGVAGFRAGGLWSSAARLSRGMEMYLTPRAFRSWRCWMVASRSC